MCFHSTRGFLYLCFLTSILVLPCLAERKFYEWELEYMHWSPDCIESVVMAINGKFPGPEIRAHIGDTIVVRLHNKLSTEGVVIHWHGITQVGTPWADGTASISQCPINPGETFVYEFKVDKAGTYFYHGHFGMQRAAGLYGSLIVEERVPAKEPFHYNGEFNLLLSDWWHQSTHRQEVDLSSIPFRFIGEPQTLLINGKGQYNCSLAKSVPSSNPQCETSSQCAPEMLHVEPNKTYRLRVASTTSLSSLNLQIGNHKMLVVEADGNYVQPFLVDDLDIYSGESYSVLLKTDQDPAKSYWISLSVRGRQPKTAPALAVLNYSPGTYPESSPPVAPLWNDYDHSKAFVKKVIANTAISPKPPRFSHRRIMLLNTQTKINGYLRWSINGISLALPPTPYLGSIKYGLTNTFDQKPPPDTYPDSYDIMSPEDDPNSSLSSSVYKLQHRTVIDVILQNANMLNATNHSEIHPWHLHGHDFWVLGYGEGKFTKRDEMKFNLKNPPLKNTVSIFPHGWTALRFIADNPGVWAFHCHIEPHLHMGMGVIFAEGAQFIKRMKVPNDAITCGQTAKLLMNHHHHHHHRP